MCRYWIYYLSCCTSSFYTFMFMYVAAATMNLQQLHAQNSTSELRLLLAFKNTSVTSDPKGFLADWSVTTTPDPCLWRGVVCSSHGKVSTLDFTNASLRGRLHINHLMALEEIRHLHFSGNSFAGNLHPDNSSGNSCVFETIDLSFNNLSEPISKAFFGYCSHLTSLNLSHNLISGDIGSSFSSNLPSSLRLLDISHNNISSSNFFALEFADCSELLVLNLAYNALTGSSPAFNALQGSSFTNCPLLEHLDLSHNNLAGKVLLVLGRMKNLRHLNLADNNFFGEIPPELGRSCGKLQELDLSANNLSGGLPHTFMSCNSLQILHLGSNQLSGDFLATVISSISSLKILSVPFNNITGPIPMSLRSCSWLQLLDLSSNAFTGNPPSWICSDSNSFSFLEELVLAGNFLSGTLPAELGNCKNLRTLDLSLNNLTGEVPLQVWLAPSIHDLVLWGNNLSGEIPEAVCSTGNNLESLILDNNNLTGTIPASLANCRNLSWLSLASNNLEGEIPVSIGTLQKLNILQLSYNSLIGTIPPELGSCRSMVWLDLRVNHLTGVIPSELASQSSLVTNGSMIEKHFAFLRQVGFKYCRMPGLLYMEKISLNRLTSFLVAKSCGTVRIYETLTVGTLADDGRLAYLDLSFNNLSEPIPDSIGLLDQLQVLRLAHNRLNGTIPETMSGLKVVGLLDLSHNHLKGRIPESLTSLTFLSDLDLSSNKLSGSIPQTGQLSTFPGSTYENNSGLCGIPLPPCSSRSTIPETYPPETVEEKEFDWFWLVASTGFVAGSVAGACIGNVVLERNEEWKSLCMVRKRRKKRG